MGVRPRAPHAQSLGDQQSHCWPRQGTPRPRGRPGEQEVLGHTGQLAELVICFLPAESILAAALYADAALLDYALSRNVVLASPCTLLAVLKSVAFTWRQDVLTDSAREFFELAPSSTTGWGPSERTSPSWARP